MLPGDNAFAFAEEEHVGTTMQRASPRSTNARKRCRSSACAGGSNNERFRAQCAFAASAAFHLVRNIVIAWIDQQSDGDCVGSSFAEVPLALPQPAAEERTPVTLPPGRLRLGDETALDGVVAGRKDNWDCRGRCLGGSTGAGDSRQSRRLGRNQVDREIGKPSCCLSAHRYSIATFWLSTTQPPQTLAECRQTWRKRARRGRPEKADRPAFAGCCALAATGHAAAAPPSREMNCARDCSGRDARFIARPPHRSVRAAFPHTAPTSGM